MTNTIEHLLHINAPLSKVYEALSKVEKLRHWYTTDIEENLDKTLTFKWGEMYLIVKFDEIENKKITWKFIESTMPIESLYMTYELIENEGKIRLKLSYVNFY